MVHLAARLGQEHVLTGSRLNDGLLAYWLAYGRLKTEMDRLGKVGNPKDSVKLRIELVSSLANLLVETHDLSQLREAVNASLGELGDVSNLKETRKLRFKARKEGLDELRIKGTDKGTWTAAMTAPMIFFFFNESLRDIEEACGSVPLTDVPFKCRAWLEKFRITDEVRREREANSALQEKANEAARLARQAILKEAQVTSQVAS